MVVVLLVFSCAQVYPTSTELKWVDCSHLSLDRVGSNEADTLLTKDIRWYRKSQVRLKERNR